MGPRRSNNILIEDMGKEALLIKELVLARIAPFKSLDGASAGHDQMPSNDLLCTALRKSIRKETQIVRRHDVVAINKCDVISMSFEHAAIPSTGLPTILLMDNAHAGIRSIGVQQIARAVGRPIIDKDELMLAVIILCKQALHAIAHAITKVIKRNNDRN